MTPTEIQLPTEHDVALFTDESILLSTLPEVNKQEPVQQGTHQLGHPDKADAEWSMFPTGTFVQVPRGSPVYDFALSNRCMVNATIAQRHPLTKASVRKLVAAVKASPDNPLHLIFLIHTNRIAMDYSKRAGEL